MQKRLMSIILAVMLLAAMATTAGAATYEEINQDAVFVKQSQRGTCTLASTAMMLRRAAMLNGDENWASITETTPVCPAGRPTARSSSTCWRSTRRASCSTPPACPTASC